MSQRDGMTHVTNAPHRALWKPTIDTIEVRGGLLAAYQAYDAWRSQFVEGKPEATADSTVEELERDGVVGLYRRGAPPPPPEPA